MSNTKNKNLNRFLSILLVFCMIFSMIPNIFAADVNKTFNIKLTWDHTNNTSEEKPDSIDVIIKSASSETSSITSTIKKMTLSKDEDLNLDNDPNTWEFSFDAQVSSLHKYFYIYEAETSEATLGFYDCTGAVTTSESVCNLNATCKYVTYYHQVEIIQKWIDNDNSYNQRPNSTPVKFSGKLTKYANDSTLKEINQNITINESEVIKTDNNTWVYTTATIQTRFPYIDISDYHLGNNYTTYVNFPTTADTVIANGLNKTTIVIEHKHDLAYDLNFSASWSDFSNYFNVRPETITLDIYGTNDINDKENGEYLGTTQLTAANNYTVKDGFYFASEKYDYIYVKSTLSNYDKTNGEYSHPIVTITKPNNVHSSSQSITNIPLNLYQTATLTVNFTPDMVNAPDNMEIKKAYVDIIHKEKVIKTIELTPDSNGVWTKTDSIDVATTSIKAQLRLNDLQTKYTIPTIDINQTLKDSKIPEAFTVDISTEYIDLNKNVSFNITKTWDDFNNKYNERPEEITVNLYGSYKENQGKELIASQIISVEDDLDKDNNPNTWEYVISGIENKYNYYYAEEVIDNSTILGSYELSSNTIEENIITNNNVEENNLIEENNNQIAQPMAFYPDYICIYKTWEDQNNINNSRPEYIDISVYTNSEDNEETKSLWFKVRLFEDDYELLEDPNDFESEFCYAYDWNFEIESFGYTLPDYIWVEEEIPAEGYKSTVSTSTSSYRGNNVSIYIVNTYFAPVSYNVNLTNTYTAPPREVQFDIVKTWVDNDDDLSLRPTSIELEIYGTNVEGATEGGVLLNTITLNSSNKVDTNTWRKTSDVIETTYEYFYVKEKDVNGYAATISPVTSPAAISDVFDPNNREEISTYVGGGAEAFTYYFEKHWEDNDNAAGKRPEYVTVNILYKTGSWSENPADYDTYLKFNLYEDKVVILEDALNRVGLGEYPSSGWATSFDLEYDDSGFMFMVTEDPVKHYTTEIGEYPMSDYNHIKYGCDIYNTYSPEPETYSVNVTNTIVPPERDVQFQIKKIWEDEFNKYKARGPVTVNIFGTDTYGATTGGEQIGSFVITEADATTSRVWEKTSPVFSTSYKYFYIEEQLPEGSRYITRIEPLEKVEPEVEFPEGYVMERPSTYAWQPPEEFSINIYKTWDDNDNAAGKRPEFIDFKVYYSESNVSVNEMSLYAKVRLYEDNVEILEDPLNRFNYDNIYTEEWTTCIESNVYEDKDWFYYVEEVPVINYATAINQELYFEGDTYGWETHVANVYCPETYKTTIINIYDKPRTVQFEIVKTWNDNNDKYHLRPTFIDIEIYGVETEGATTGGELIETVRLTFNNRIDSNIWKKRITELETDYEYFYVKEINGSSSYTTSISPVTETEAVYDTPESTNAVSSNEDPYGVSPAISAGFEYGMTLRVHKLDENGNYLPGAELKTIDADIDYGWYGRSWTSTNTYFETYVGLVFNSGLALDSGFDHDLWYVHEVNAPEGYRIAKPVMVKTSDIDVFKDYTFTQGRADEDVQQLLNFMQAIEDGEIPADGEYIYDAYMINEPIQDAYRVDITNTVIPPEKDVQFKVNKIWNDYLNKYNSRGPVTINIYGTNTEGATTGGSLVGSFTMTEEDFVERNIWSKTSPVFSTAYEYFYLEEVFNGENYTATISPLTKLDPPTNTVEPTSDEGISPYMAMPSTIWGLGLYKYWEDNDNAAGKRPEFIDFEVYFSETETEIEKMDLLCKFRMYRDAVEGLEDPYGKFGLDYYPNPYGEFCDIAMFDAEERYNFALKEIPVPNYTSTVTFSDGWGVGFALGDSSFNVTNTYYVETYEATITNTYDAPRTIDFELTKVWNDNNNEAGKRPDSVQIEIYGVETEGATTGGTLIHTETLTVDNATDDNTWKKQIEDLATDYEYFYIKEKNMGNDYVASISPITKKEPITRIEQMFPQEYSVSETAQDEYGIAPAYAGGSFYYGFRVRVHKLDEHGNYLPNVKMFITDYEEYYGDKCGGQWTTTDTYYETEVYLGNTGGLEANWIVHDMWYIMEEEAPEGYELLIPVCIKTSEMEVFKDVEEFGNGLYPTFGETQAFYKLIEDGIIPPSGEYVHDFYVYNTPIQDRYSATITNTYTPPTEVIFNITKTWDDNNNAANLRPLGIQVKIYGTNTEGATTGGTLIDTVVLTNEDVSSTNANVWNKTVVLDADYDYFYVVELSSLGTELNTYTLTNNTVTEVNNTVQPSSRERYSISTFAFSAADILTIEKYWEDNDNALGVRPDNIILNLYYNTEDDESSKKLLAKMKLTETQLELLDVDSNYFSDLTPTEGENWYFILYLDQNVPEYLWLEEENLSIYDMEYYRDFVVLDDTYLGITNTLKELRTYNINLTNKLDSLPIKVTKIWRDDNNKYDTRPDSLDITVYQNGTVFEVITFTSANMIGGNINVWESTINVPKFDENGNEYIYTISEDETNLELGYYYYEPSINQSSLIATNVGVWLPPIDVDVTPEYSIIVGKEIVDENDEIATAEDFWKLKLNIDDTYEFPIVLKELEKVLSKGNTSMEEEYEGYTGNVIHGVLTNKGQLLFTNIKPGKYEISEIINQYFDFVGMEKIESTEGASLTYEDGKYYITLSGVTKDSESISIKVINRLEDERPFNDVGIKDNLFVIPERENIDHNQPQD